MQYYVIKYKGNTDVVAGDNLYYVNSSEETIGDIPTLFRNLLKAKLVWSVCCVPNEDFEVVQWNVSESELNGSNS